MPRHLVEPDEVYANVPYPHQEYSRDAKWPDIALKARQDTTKALKDGIQKNLLGWQPDSSLFRSAEADLDNESGEINSEFLEAGGLKAHASINKCTILEKGQPLNRKFPGCPAKKKALVSDWQSVLRDFVYSNSELESVLAVFVHKTVVMGVQNWSWATSTLMDMTWAILLLSWEAFQTGTLPAKRKEHKLLTQEHQVDWSITEIMPAVKEPDEEPSTLRQRYEELLNQFLLCRSQWLEEVQNLRDIKRKPKWDSLKQEAVDAAMEQDVYKFLPDAAIEEDQKQYFRAALEECVKVALMRSGGSCPLCEILEAQLKRLQDEYDQLAAKGAELDEEGESLNYMPPPPQSRRPSPPAVGRGPAKPDLAPQLEAAQKENDDLKQQLGKVRDEVEMWKRRNATVQITEADIFDDAKWARVLERWQEGQRAIVELIDLRNAPPLKPVVVVEDVVKVRTVHTTSTPSGPTAHEIQLQKDLDNANKRAQALQATIAAHAAQIDKQAALLQQLQQQEHQARAATKEVVQVVRESDPNPTFIHVDRPADNNELKAAQAREAEMQRELDRLKAELDKRDADILRLQSQQVVRQAKEVPEVETPAAEVIVKETKIEKVVVKNECNCNTAELIEENNRLKAALQKAKMKIPPLATEIEELKLKIQELKDMLLTSGIVPPELLEVMFKQLDRSYDDAKQRAEQMSLLINLLSRNMDHGDGGPTKEDPAAQLEKVLLTMPKGLEQAVQSVQALNASQFATGMDLTPPPTMPGRAPNELRAAVAGDDNGQPAQSGARVDERILISGVCSPAVPARALGNSSMRYGAESHAAAQRGAQQGSNQTASSSPSLGPSPAAGAQQGSSQAAFSSPSLGLSPPAVGSNAAAARPQSSAAGRGRKVPSRAPSRACSPSAGGGESKASSPSNGRKTLSDTHARAKLGGFGHVGEKISRVPKAESWGQPQGRISPDGDARETIENTAGVRRTPTTCSKLKANLDGTVFQEYCRTRGALEAEIKVETPARMAAKSFQLSHLLLGPLRNSLVDSEVRDNPKPLARRPGSGGSRDEDGGSYVSSRDGSRPSSVGAVCTGRSPRRPMQESESLPVLGRR